MTIKCFFKPAVSSNFTSLALLILRFIVGIAFLHHGWMKIQHPFSWMPPEAPVPHFLQFLAAISEFGGGIALILGLLTRLASLGLVCTMTVAVCMHAIVRGDPFVSSKGGMSYELALVYWSISLLFLALGAGKFSLDKAFFGERS